MIAFSTTSNLLQKKNHRIEQFKNDNGDEATYKGVFTEEWFKNSNLTTSIEEDLN